MGAAPPPAYNSAPATRPSSSLSAFEALPPHLLQSIVALLPLPTLVFGLRPASRTLYTHAMAAAREWALSLWFEEVERAAAARGGGGQQLASTDPLGDVQRLTADSSSGDGLPAYSAASSSTTSSSPPPSPLASRSRELAVLDLFLVSLARSSALLAASTLFSAANDSSALPASWGGGGGGEGSSVRSDLFGLLQPKARCEDLVIAEGRRRGVVEPPEGERGSSADEKTPSGPPSSAPIRAQDLRVDLKLRQASLLLPFPSASGRAGSLIYKPVVTVPRRVPEDSLEDVAKRLVGQVEWLRVVRRWNGQGAVWYEVR